MAGPFPHLTQATEFPGTDNINAYKYRNEFAYTRYQVNVNIKVCTVPWDGDYANTVKFDDDAARDAYLDGLDGYTFDTMFNVLPSTSVKLPVPPTAMQVFNYCVVDLPIATSPDNPIEYAAGDRVERYCYFISGVSQGASNTSELALTLDVWATYINRVTFSYAMLSRGHAPMAATTVDDYLADPRDNSEYLLAGDVDFGSGSNITRAQQARIFSGGDQFAVFCCWSFHDGDGRGNIYETPSSDSGYPDWGTADDYTWNNPAPAYCTTQGYTSPRTFAIDAEDFRGFLTDVNEQEPQFIADVRGIFYIAKDLVECEATHAFCGHTIYFLNAYQHVENLYSLTKDDFGYAEPYSEIAKLYTYPYAYIAVDDSDGGTTEVRIEDTSGSIDVRTCLQIILPWVKLDAHLLNIGHVSDTVYYRTGYYEREFTYGGSFTDTYKEWNVPVFQVAQSSATDATWAHLYDRRQAQLAADNNLDSATTTAEKNLDSATNTAEKELESETNEAGNDLDSATTTAANERDASLATAQARYNNANATATMQRTNSYNQASNMVANNALSVAANEDMNTIQTANAFTKTTRSAALQSNLTIWDNSLIDVYLTADTEELAAAQQNNRTAAQAGFASTFVDSLGTFLSGDIVGTATTAINGTINTLSNYEQASNTNAVTISNKQTIAAFNKDSNDNKTTLNNDLATDNAQLNNDEANSLLDIRNSLNNAVTSNNAGLVQTNADNLYNTQTANASRTYAAEQEAANLRYDAAINAANNSYDSAITTANNDYDAAVHAANNTYDAAINQANNDYDTAVNDILNTRLQQGMRAPLVYGSAANGDTAVSRPIAYFTRVVTEPDASIRAAGDQFLRYGYTLNQQWHITDLQVMKYFTYWQCEELWVDGANDILEGAQSVIKSIMRDGVTVWSDPDTIGKVSIYDNI